MGHLAPMGKSLWYALLLLLLLIIAAGSAVFINGRLRREHDLAVCRRNLDAIGIALAAYGRTEGVYPAALADLPLGHGVTPVCPISKVPYHYLVGRRRVAAVQAATPIVLDDPAAHGGQQGNVLYADGVIKMMDSRRIEAILRLDRFRPPALMPATTKAAGVKTP